MAGAITSSQLLGLAVALEDDPARRHELRSGWTLFDAATREGLVDRMQIESFAVSVGEAVQQGYLRYETESAGVILPPPDRPWTDHALQSRFDYSTTLDGRQLVATNLSIALHAPVPVGAHERTEEARRKLRSDAKADAVVAAVEGALAPFLFGLATAHEISTLDDKGRPLVLARLNERLRLGGIYSKAREAQVASWLHDRNEIAHGRGDGVARRWVELLIDSIEYFVSDDPAALVPESGAGGS